VPYTSDDLVTDIERDSFAPAAQSQFTAAQKLKIADDELQESLAPILAALDAGYFLESADTALVADQAGYDFDRYAMWNKVRRVELLDANGSPREIDLVTPEQRSNYDITTNGPPRAFELSHTQIVLLPTPAVATETLRQWIYRRPGRLVPVASAAVVQSVDTGTGIVTYTASKPATFTSSSVHDFYRGNSPFRRVGTAATATASGSATTHTFSLANAALITAGDYVCLRDETVFPCVPIELVPFLKDLVIRSLARSQMDQAAYQVARAEVVDRAKAAMAAGPGARAVGHPKKISIPLQRVFGGRKRRVVAT
jgi:hypothetical protein